MDIFDLSSYYTRHTLFQGEWLIFGWLRLLSEILLVVSLVNVLVVSANVVNSLDGHLQYECAKSNQFISDITSVHNNHAEDRVFDMSCSDVTDDTVGLVTSCSWTEYINDYDHPMDYQCSGNRYISGMESDHNNHYEDRRWKLKCCEMHEIHLGDCHFTSWTNEYDKPQNFHSGSYTTKGVVSVHNNYYEDRQYKYEICKVYRNDGSSLVGRRRANHN